MPVRNLYSQILTIMTVTPELRPYKIRLFGSCCRRPTDEKLAARIKAFLVQYPEFRQVLGRLVGT